MIIEYFEKVTDLYRIKLEITGNSVAFSVPFSYRPMTVQLSELTGRTKVQYTLGTEAEVEADTADWYDTSAGYVSTPRGSTFDTPVSYFRIVVETQTDSYTVEALQ